MLRSALTAIASRSSCLVSAAARRDSSKLLSTTFARGMAVVRKDGQFKTWKPITPGLRHRRMVVRDHLHKGKPIRALTVAKRRTGGRCRNTGRITCRHRGGGFKRRIRLVDFNRFKAGASQVVRLEYDPGRTAHIALLKHLTTNELSYIVAPEGLQQGMIVRSYRFLQYQPEKIAKEDQALKQEVESNMSYLNEQRRRYLAKIISGGEAVQAGSSSSSSASESTAAAATGSSTDSNITRQLDLSIGTCMPLKYIPMGTVIHCISLSHDGKAALCRAAGTSARLLATGQTGHALLKLQSGEIRKIPVEACATIGSVCNANHKHEQYGTAGARRRRGWRPRVRGVAQNVCDHPLGGGRGKSKSNRIPVSPWGKPSKGGRTRTHINPLVVKRYPTKTRR
ncbi:ribosomal protein L2 [Ramicandelaber brevisporus]|nr:ribosomal protein L2 [Ramicandelaber brevisporus]